MYYKGILAIVFTLVLVLLGGCTSNYTNEIKEEIERLKARNTQLIDTINQFEFEMKKFEQANKDLELEMNNLKELISESEYTDTSLKSSFNIINEGFYVEPVMVFHDDLTLEKFKMIMGEPKYVRDYIEEAHCGCQETEVTYDNASFTFQRKLIKWMTLRDTTLVTQRGVTVGSPKEQVIERYGDKFRSDRDGSINYGEKTGIRFNFDNNNVVDEITIWYMYE